MWLSKKLPTDLTLYLLSHTVENVEFSGVWRRASALTVATTLIDCFNSLQLPSNNTLCFLVIALLPTLRTLLKYRKGIVPVL